MSQLDRTHRQVNCSLPSNSSRVRLKCTIASAYFASNQSFCMVNGSTSNGSNFHKYLPTNYAHQPINAINAAKLIVSEQHIRCADGKQCSGRKLIPHGMCVASILSGRFTIYITILSMLLACVSAIESELCEPKVLNKTPPDPVCIKRNNAR